MPYALALVVTGLVVGALHLIPQVHLDPRTLFTDFLPPLLQIRTVQSEYRRLASERMACQAALQELERLWVTEAFPHWSIQALVAEYRERWEELGEEIAALPMEDLARDQEQDAELRRLALLTEKGMLQEAERRGWLDEEDWRNLVERIDTQLVALQEGREAG